MPKITVIIPFFTPIRFLVLVNLNGQKDDKGRVGEQKYRSPKKPL